MNEQLILSVSDFVAVLNQTLEYAYPQVTIVGELSNFKVSKGRWVYFDLKDEHASVRFFGTVYALPGPLEDGMKLQVSGAPRLHPQFGFSVGFQQIQPVGEGSIKKASELLKAKLQAEGLFDPSRKRALPYPPTKIGLVASAESAAYADFIKIINARWQGIEIVHADVQVQGELAPQQISDAIDRLNLSDDIEVIVVTRGGGSADDLQSFSTEQVVRAIAASRTPTLVAIGHEIDISLAELAADKNASTPSNAAELLVPDRQQVLQDLEKSLLHTERQVMAQIDRQQLAIQDSSYDVASGLQDVLDRAQRELDLRTQTLQAYDPTRILRRGYAWLKSGDTVVTSANQLQKGGLIDLRLSDGAVRATIDEIERYTKQ